MRSPRRVPRPSFRRALAIGLAVSLVVHLLVLLFAWQTTLVPVPKRAEAPPILADAGGERNVMRVERIVPVPDAVPDVRAPVQPEREEPTPAPRPAAPAGPGAAEAEAEPARDVPATSRLRPRMGDPRLWTRPDVPPPPEPSDIQRVRARIASRLGVWNDSVAAEAGRAADALDWTFKDGNGGKWGISPGKLHLGGITLPLPIPGGGPSPKREESEERAREDAAILDQAARAGADQNFKDRVKAIRERKDRERSEKKSGGGTGSSSGTGSGAGAGSDSAADSDSGAPRH
ncbi:MAG TPA: hypothetical protein VF212_09215 [Longimicrobiales bacterium]